MQTISVDLTKDPEVAALVADMEPGACIYGCFRLKSKDDQTATLRLEEMAAEKDELSDKHEEPDGDEDGEEDSDEDGDESETPAPPEKTRGARMASALEGSASMPVM